MEKACKVLVVLADTQAVENTTLLRRCASEFCTLAMQTNMEIEFVDLIKDGYRYRTPLLVDTAKKSDQVIDYQMQLKSADWVIFFYQTALGTMPGILKSYLDVVMAPGVGYSSTDGDTYFDHKKATVYVFEPKNQIEAQLYNANREDFFWNRMVFRTTGLKGELKQFFNVEKIDGKKIDTILMTIAKLVANYRPVVA